MLDAKIKFSLTKQDNQSYYLEIKNIPKNNQQG
jgi:hypothetical protein